MRKTINQKFLYGIALVWLIVLAKFIWQYHVVATASGATGKSEFEQICVEVDGALKEQNATNISYTVTLVAKGTSRTKEEQKQLLSEVAKMTGGQEECINMNLETKANGTSLSWEINQSDMCINAQYLDMKEDYIVITIECKACEKASYYMTYFEELVKAYELTGIPCMEITAYLPEMLNFTERNVLSENIFYMFQAEEVDGIRGADLYTIYGYSNLIPSRISVADQLMNLNFSCSLIEETAQTKLQIGIPVL